ncbi:hypothetical protein Q762_14140 [Flavobacterium cauense R2A-7]|uniref:hypothetical protein n=1 Tax=Flavobacterium cauense TaxID=510946 RepID=UPI00052B96B2|nr:hypothetical protein [Flavobacterium cauense]KGO79631.1 hypothetical protein Q762_14140 [Flavobacterium cauense R2A-7]
MKSVIFFLFLILVKNPLQEKFRLNGKYKVVPSNGRTYFIEFNDSIYVKTRPNGTTSTGIVQYGGNLIYLRDFERELKMVNRRVITVETKPKEMDLIALKTGKQDSIEYSHHAYREGGPINWLHITDEQGKLIKIK